MKIDMGGAMAGLLAGLVVALALILLSGGCRFGTLAPAGGPTAAPAPAGGPTAAPAPAGGPTAAPAPAGGPAGPAGELQPIDCATAGPAEVEACAVTWQGAGHDN
jgi:hypothetical protein